MKKYFIFASEKGVFENKKGNHMHSSSFLFKMHPLPCGFWQLDPILSRTITQVHKFSRKKVVE